MNLELPPSQTINALGSVPSRVLQPLQPGQLRCAQRDGFQQFPKSHPNERKFWSNSPDQDQLTADSICPEAALLR